jgi:hypothetical protein
VGKSPVPLISLTFLTALAASLPPVPLAGLEIAPAEARLHGSTSQVQLVVTGRGTDGQDHDLTHDPSTTYASLDPAVATIDRAGLIRPSGDGSTRILVRSGTLLASIAVTAQETADQSPVWFAADVVPILTRLGCNGGMCHGKAGGQNGFRLSLLGFDPVLDHDSLTRDARGRRVFPAAPAASLMLLKPTAAIAHGGGRRLVEGSPEYWTIARWIGQGSRSRPEAEPRLERIAIAPQRRLVAAGQTQQLRVVAHYRDRPPADVTRLALYESNRTDLASVDGDGRVRASGAVGEAPIVARFGGQVAVARLLIPGAGAPLTWEPPPSENLIDGFVFAKLRDLHLAPAATCTDSEFTRRTALDICGVLPDPEEVAELEASVRADKRALWVERLLERPEYADLFAMKWSAILRNQRSFGSLSQPGTFAFHDWIRQALADNLPYDRFVAAIVAASGDVRFHPPVVWYRQVKSLEEQVDDTAQLFLGIRLQCARCHHHPSERWGPDDYYGFAALFSRIGRKPGPDLDPITPSLYLLTEGLAENPDTHRRYHPRLPGGEPLTGLGSRDDPRQALVAWMRDRRNPYFAPALVNRYWKHFFGRGLVEPEDDLRVSNPATHPELLQALADDFIDHGFDLKRLVRTIATSRAYDRSSLPPAGASGADSAAQFGRFAPRRLPAEVLLDAIGTVTGVREAFAGLPRSLRATQLPDEGFVSGFLEVFGRPRRESVCECERKVEANLAQSLLLLSSADIEQKLAARSGRIDGWLAEALTDAARIDELYRIGLARRPTEEEARVCLDHLAHCRARGRLRQGYEDLVWALINTKEFLFNH